MPAIYTFHRFGADALRHMHSQQQGLIQRFRRMYNGGVHGADLFFYFNPGMPTAVGSLYEASAAMTGADFFTRACGWLKQNPSEGGTACLYGLLANYCLNTQLSRLFREATADGSLSRVELETEMDRYLLGLDGKVPAHRQDLSELLKMTRGECVTLSGFFPLATAANVNTAHRRMVRWTRRFAGKARWFARFLLHMVRGSFRAQMMEDHANHKCLHLDKAMLECYERALEMYPEMLQRLNLYMKNGIPLGEDFEATFW